MPESWSPDGTHIAFSVIKSSEFSLWMFSTADRKVAPFGDIRSVEPIGAVFSPDGRWIAYGMMPPGQGPMFGLAGASANPNRGVYLHQFPGGARYQVPRQALDFHPTWGPRGTELFFIPTATSGQLTSAVVTTLPTVSFGNATLMPARVTTNRISSEMRAYDILPDGRFVGLVEPAGSEALAGALVTEMRVVLNWTEELKRLVPTR